MKRSASALLIVTQVLLGIVAFLFPFVINMHSTPGTAHSVDAPFWSALLSLLIVASIVTDLRSSSASSIQIALLGLCSGVLAALRLFDLPNGANAMFFFVVLLGAGFGARFGYYVGAIGMLTSAFFTGGFGPWLPFQAIALAWMGAGAGIIVNAIGDKRTPQLITALAIYAFVWGFLYGALLNLWFWPLYATSGSLSYHVGESVTQNLHHYWAFYVATSAVWDAAAAFTNALFVIVVGVPILRSFRRLSHRLSPSVEWQGDTLSAANV